MRSAFVYNFLIEARHYPDDSTPEILPETAWKQRNLLRLAAGGHPTAMSAVFGQSADS